MIDLSILVALISIGVVGGGILLTNSVRYYTIREHEAFDEGLDKRLHEILDRIKVLEQTRPTTGELRAWVTKQINGDH